MKLSLKILSMIVGICALQSVYAVVYVCQDKNGHKEYTSEKSIGCVEESIGALSTYSTSYSPATSSSDYSIGGYGTPANYSQNYTELNSYELQNKLEEAQKNLEEGKKVRKAGEQNYARYKRRIRGLEAEVNKAQDALNQGGVEQTLPASTEFAK